jgi:hypothetical protein
MPFARPRALSRTALLCRATRSAEEGKEEEKEEEKEER